MSQGLSGAGAAATGTVSAMANAQAWQTPDAASAIRLATELLMRGCGPVDTVLDDVLGTFDSPPLTARSLSAASTPSWGPPMPTPQN